MANACRLLWLTCIMLVLFLAYASTDKDTRTVLEFETTRSTPTGWRKDNRAPPDSTLTLTLALKQQNAKQLEAQFNRISDPTDVMYRRFLSVSQIREMTAATDDAVFEVLRYLSAHKVEYSLSATRDWVTVKLPVQTAERMLQVEFFRFIHKDTGIALVRTLDTYSVPSSIAQHLDFIGGVARFPKLSATKPANGATPMAAVTPGVIKTRAGINITGSGNPKVIQAVAQFLGQYYSPKDLATFLERYGTSDTQKVDKVVGPNDPSKPGLEASLDIEYIMGVAEGVKTWFYYTAGLHENQEPFLEWATSLNDATTIPSVVSVSYGDTESSISIEYTSRVDVEFMKLGARGTSIFFASGDDGVGCEQSCNRHQPNWPATSPYVTAVGGVVLEGNNLVGDQISSGGFSNYFARPSYQSQDVAKYLADNKNLPDPKFYNSSGRAVPDIASYSEDVVIIVNEQTDGVGGTSCAAPVAAAMFSLVNDILVSKGKPTLGFLNPLIYSTLSRDPNLFTDVTTGVNTNGCCPGFHCQQGWDPVTGFGVPKNPIEIAAKVMSLTE